MVSEINLENLEQLAIGSAFLGTGGGGDPYLGSLLCREALTKYGPVPLISVDELDDSDNIFIAAAMGAPTVMIEKLFSVEDQHHAVQALETYLGRTADAIISAEIGGCNSMMPVAYAAMRGLPLIDGDGMGRAFPQLQMTSMNVHGIGCAPMTLADEHGNSILIQAKEGLKAEQIARPVVAEMGASVCMSCYPMTGAQAKNGIVPSTISAALAIGAAVENRSGGEASPIDRLLSALRAHDYYGDAYNLFEGKITGLDRDTSRGWVFGQCNIRSLNDDHEAIVTFQNENLTIHIDEKLHCIVPDLLTIIDTETAQAIPTERLAYGQRVTVIGCSAPPHLTSPEALKIMGPQCFELSDAYLPIRALRQERG